MLDFFFMLEIQQQTNDKVMHLDPKIGSVHLIFTRNWCDSKKEKLGYNYKTQQQFNIKEKKKQNSLLVTGKIDLSY